MKPYTYGTQLKDVGEGKQPAVRNQILTCVLALCLKTVGYITSLSWLLLLFYQPFNQQSYIFVRRLSIVGQGCLIFMKMFPKGQNMKVYPEVLSVTFVKTGKVSSGEYYRQRDECWETRLLLHVNSWQFFLLDNQMQIRLSPDRYMERLILTDVKNYWDQTIALCAT